MGLDNEFLLKGLLQHNYFPSQKEDKEEMPPVLSSKQFSLEVAKILLSCATRKSGYDQIEYRLTRHTNVPRPLSIPHPLAYLKLSNSLADNWNHIKYITETDSSLIIPRQHDDGRIIIMKYENKEEEIERHIQLTFNKKYIVRTDISNFFPSIYSHSIPWGLVGFDTSKNNRDISEWFNQIDFYQRIVKRNETNGIPIGPATSNIVSEAILAKIDKELSDVGYVFIRYIDDYTGYFDTNEKAQEFILVLSEKLASFKLVLNIKKTNIEQLPTPCSPEWIVDLTTRAPDKKNLTSIQIIRYLDFALNKQSTNPDGSVLKYAAKSIINDVENEAAEIMLKYLLGLCSKYAILVPLLDILFEKMTFDLDFSYGEQLLNILDEHALYKRSDAMTWALYYLNKYSQLIPQKVAENVIKTRDCISILLLYLSHQHDKAVEDFYTTLDNDDLYQLDQYWLLLYQLFFDGKITNPYENINAYTNHLSGKKDTKKDAMQREIQVFNILKDNDVTFIESFL